MFMYIYIYIYIYIYVYIYRSKKSNISYIWNITLVLTCSYVKCGNKNDKIFKDKKSTKILWIVILIDKW